MAGRAQDIAARDTSEAAAEDFLGPYFPYHRIASLPTASLGIGGGMLRVMTVSSPDHLTRQQVLAWVEARARAVAQYFGALPGAPVDLLLVCVDGAGVKGGTSWGHRGAASRVLIGKGSSSAHFDDDWVLVHELVHHALPSVAPRHHWMEEGLATYVEPVVRVRAGLMTLQAYWQELMAGLPKGLPASDDRGLDNTPTWGRTYWGGALFYFLADLEALRRTEKGLREGLVALQRAGGNITQSWPPRRIFETLDGALGVEVFEPLYARMRASPHPVVLDDLWQQLGVALRDGTVIFDDAAPLASVRRAMTGESAVRMQN